MGDFESAEIPRPQDPGANRTPVKAAVIMFAIGLIAPLFVTYQSYGLSWYMIIQSMLWAYYASSSIYPGGQGFSFMSPFVLFSMFPLVLLRLVPALQIYRYYKGKTTRRRTIYSLFIGDGFVLFYGLLAVFMISFGMYMIMIPVTAQIIIGAFILWRFPYREPRTPWDSVLEEKQWWEKNQEPKEKKPKDEDVLW